jgi:small subunit ribosomal protein S20
MPILKNAKKKLRQDKKRTSLNNKVRSTIDKAFVTLKKVLNTDNVAKAYSVIDKAQKKNVLHKNTAARLKSKAQRLVSKS